MIPALILLVVLTFVSDSLQSCQKKAALTECFNVTITRTTIETIDKDIVVLSMKYGTPQATISAGTFQNLPKLEKLFLSFANIQRLQPGAFQSLGNLRELHLTNNELQSIPSGIFDNCRRLDILNLNLNRITTIADDAFNEIVELEELDLSSNMLERVPNIRNLVSLKTLNLGYNKFRTINSGSFSNLGRLMVLKLNDNKLTALEPNALRGLRNLRELDIRTNYIVDLDATNLFQTCSRLQKIAFSVNDFKCRRLRSIVSEFQRNRVEVVEGVSTSHNAVHGISCKN